MGVEFQCKTKSHLSQPVKDRSTTRVGNEWDLQVSLWSAGSPSELKLRICPAN